jgi:hypothetical protein
LAYATAKNFFSSLGVELTLQQQFPTPLDLPRDQQKTGIFWSLLFSHKFLDFAALKRLLFMELEGNVLIDLRFAKVLSQNKKQANEALIGRGREMKLKALDSRDNHSELRAICPRPSHTAYVFVFIHEWFVFLFYLLCCS